MRRLWPRHVRSRMTLWYVLVLGVLLLAYAGVASSYLFFSLRKQLDHDLLEDSERVEGRLENSPDGMVTLGSVHHGEDEPRYADTEQPGEEENMKWITRKDIKVDRVACPWLIKRFIDPQAEFLFVEETDLLEQAKQQDAIPFDAPKIEAIKLNHRGPGAPSRQSLKTMQFPMLLCSNWH